MAMRNFQSHVKRKLIFFQSSEIWGREKGLKSVLCPRLTIDEKPIKPGSRVMKANIYEIFIRIIKADRKISKYIPSQIFPRRLLFYINCSTVYFC